MRPELAQYLAITNTQNEVTSAARFTQSLQAVVKRVVELEDIAQQELSEQIESKSVHQHIFVHAHIVPCCSC